VFGRRGAAFAKVRELSVILGLHHGRSQSVIHGISLCVSLGTGGGWGADGLFCAPMGLLVCQGLCSQQRANLGFVPVIFSPQCFH